MPDGTVQRYLPAEPPEDPASVGDWRVMDCIDCHNRPTHIYQTPEAAVDKEIESGRIARSLPYIRRESVRALKAAYASNDEARREIRAKISAFYADEYPEVAAEQGDAILRVGEVLGEIHSANVFPSMKVGWGTYPDHIGHETSDGCFRCHFSELETAQGDRISSSCESCHAIVAQGPSADLSMLESDLNGLEFQHPVDVGDVWDRVPCTGCHTPAQGY